MDTTGQLCLNELSVPYAKFSFKMLIRFENIMKIWLFLWSLIYLDPVRQYKTKEEIVLAYVIIGYTECKVSLSMFRVCYILNTCTELSADECVKEHTQAQNLGQCGD